MKLKKYYLSCLDFFSNRLNYFNDGEMEIHIILFYLMNNFIIIYNLFLFFFVCFLFVLNDRTCVFVALKIRKKKERKELKKKKM